MRATIKPYKARASLKINIMSKPTYSLLASSAAIEEPPIPPAPSSPSEVSQLLFPPLAFCPKPCTPTSPITPIVPPAARPDKPQQRPAASCTCC